MRILVTGGAGFVGSHIARRFLELGHSVDVIDDGRASVDFCPSECTRISADLADLPEQIFDCDAIVHCAARADVRNNWTWRAERERLWHDNISATISLLERAPDVPIVFFSTGAIYAMPPRCLYEDWNEGILDEDWHEQSTSPYVASKLAGEKLVEAYARRLGSSWYAIRPGCIVGSNYHHGHIADFVRMAKEGTITAMSDGRGDRSFVHVGDVASATAHLLLGEKPSGVYNLETGLWSPRRTVDVMGRARIVEVAWAERDHGWVGDNASRFSAAKLRGTGWERTFSVERGVCDALRSLGWT
jgi:nucleoside-diphosphate-sugar epimerase